MLAGIEELAGGEVEADVEAGLVEFDGGAC